MQGGHLEQDAFSCVAIPPPPPLPFPREKGRLVQFLLFCSVDIISFNTSKALKCLISWVQFGVTITEVDDVLPQVFESVLNPELFDTSVDLMVEVATHPSGIK